MAGLYVCEFACNFVSLLDVIADLLTCVQGRQVFKLLAVDLKPDPGQQGARIYLEVMATFGVLNFTCEGQLSTQP